MTARGRKNLHRRLIEERVLAEKVHDFRAKTWRRLRAARVYELGAEVLGPLSTAGREAWIRATSLSPPAGTDQELRLSAEVTRAKGLVPAADGSAWVTSR